MQGIGKYVEFTTPVATAGSRQSFLALFDKTNLRATVLASVPWFLQDLGTYGIGIFTPTILAASIGHRTAHVRSLADLISNDELAAKDPKFKKLYDSVNAFRGDSSIWLQIAELSFDGFMIRSRART